VPAKYRIHFVFARVVAGLDINPRFFRGVEPGLWFHYTVPATFAPMKYLRSQSVMKWSVCRLCSLSCLSTSWLQISDRTNIRWIAKKYRDILLFIRQLLIATQRLLVRSQIWQCELNERPMLHSIRTDHVIIRLEFKCLIVAKNKTQDTNFKIYCKTESSTNQKQYAVRYEHSHTMVNGIQLTK